MLSGDKGFSCERNFPGNHGIKKETKIKTEKRRNTLSVQFQLKTDRNFTAATGFEQ
jgi:hypothetical protein